MDSVKVRRDYDGRVRKPEALEPHCIHSTHIDVVTQPASACRFCSKGEPLARWKAEWAAWLAENPDSYEARWVAAQDAK